MTNWELGNWGIAWRVLEFAMSSAIALQLTLVLGIVSLLPSCSIIKVPVETAGTVEGASVRVAEKAATTGVEVAGKAAGAVIEGKLPIPGKPGW
jgi:hypothetical protein